MYGTAIKQGGTADIVYSSLAETDGVSARFFYSGRQPDRLCGSDASKQAAGSRSDAAESGAAEVMQSTATQPKAGG